MIAEYCKSHIPNEMYIDVISKRCKYVGCKTRPNYGLEETMIAEYCKSHIPNEMYVDVKSKRCKHPDCKKLSTYGLEHTMIAEYCKSHIPDDRYIDVKHKKCKHLDCKTRTSYGIPGYSPEYCAKHKKSGMVKNPTKYEVDKKQCEFCCTDINYNENYCNMCKSWINNNGRTDNRKKKENVIKKLLQDNKYEYSNDLTVKDGCSKKRPDFIIQAEWGTIILEVDEHQHARKTYTCECEITRMSQLYFDLGLEYLHFIRYNPDEFVSGCVSGNANYWTNKKRQEYLLKHLGNVLINKPQYNLSVIYMFYDGFIEEQEIENVDPYKETPTPD